MARVTDTQKLIVAEALRSVGRVVNGPDDSLVVDVASAMLVVEKGGMQPYFLGGFKWSCSSRSRDNPEQVRADVESLEEAVDTFHQGINVARGEAARRIRGNRSRRIRALEREAQRQLVEAQLQRFALRQRLIGGGYRPLLNPNFRLNDGFAVGREVNAD